MRKKYKYILEDMSVRLKNLEAGEFRIQKFIDRVFEEKIAHERKSIDEIKKKLRDAGITRLGLNSNLLVSSMAVPIAQQIEAIMKHLNVEFENQPATEGKIIVKEVKK